MLSSFRNTLMCALRHSVVIQEFLEALKVEVKLRAPYENETAYACDICEVRVSGEKTILLM